MLDYAKESVQCWTMPSGSDARIGVVTGSFSTSGSGTGSCIGGPSSVVDQQLWTSVLSSVTKCDDIGAKGGGLRAWRQSPPRLLKPWFGWRGAFKQTCNLAVIEGCQFFPFKAFPTSSRPRLPDVWSSCIAKAIALTA